MNGRYLIAVVAALAVIGLSAPAAAADLTMILENPQQYEGKQVTITAPIAENMVPEGGEYRTWSFVLDSCGAAGLLTATESGFNPQTIEEAYRLVEEARLSGEPVTVTGTLEESALGMELALNTVEYAGTKVNTDGAPFVDTYWYGDDGYPGPVYFYEGRAYYGPDYPEVEPPPAHLRYKDVSGCPVEE